MNPVEQLAGAGEIVAGFLDRLEPDAAVRQSPCAGWDVHDVTNHLVAGNLAATAILTGADLPERGEDHLGEDWPASLRRSVAELVTAFSAPEVATSTYRAPVGEIPGPAFLMLRTVEQTVHGWDIARGLSRDPSALSPIAAELYEPSQQLLAQLPAERRPFDEPVEVADDAPAIDRLVALLGRTPG